MECLDFCLFLFDVDDEFVFLALAYFYHAAFLKVCNLLDRVVRDVFLLDLFDDLLTA